MEIHYTAWLWSWNSFFHTAGADVASSGTTVFWSKVHLYPVIKAAVDEMQCYVPKIKKRKVRRTRGLWRKYIRILFLYSNPKVKKNSSSVQPSKQKFLRGKKLVIPTLNELHLQIKFLIMLGTSEPPAGGSPVQEPVNKKPTSSMFI